LFFFFSFLILSLLLSFFPDCLWGKLTLLPNPYRWPFPWGLSGRDVKLTTLFYLVPRLRIHGAIPPLSQHVFVAWCLVK
jgi:hypothetical protein